MTKEKQYFFYNNGTAISADTNIRKLIARVKDILEIKKLSELRNYYVQTVIKRYK